MTTQASTELLHRPEYQFAAANPEQLVLAQQGLVDVIMQAYLKRGVVDNPNDTVKRLVRSDLLDSQTFRSRVASVVDAAGNSFTPTEFDAVGESMFEWSHQEAFTMAYAYRSFQRAVNGKKLRRDQQDTLADLSRGLNTDSGPVTFYGEVSRMWATAVGEALDNEDPKAAAKSLGKIYEIATLLSPEDDHPSNRASIAAISVLQKIAAGEKYTDYEYRRISRLANAHVPSNVRKLAQPATENYVDLVENIAAHITSNRSAMTPGQLKRYCRLLKNLRIEVDITVPDDAADIEELERQNDDPITVHGESNFDDATGRIAPVKLKIRTTPKKYDALFKTGVAAALAGAAVVATIPVFNQPDGGSNNETVAAQPPKAKQPPVASETLNPPVATPETPPIAAQPEVIVNTDQPINPGQTESEPSIPEPYTPTQNNHQPAIPEVINPSDLPTLQLSETAQPVNTGADDKANHAITPEAVNNAVEEDLLGEATDEMAEYLLQFNPETSISKHDEYVDDVELLTARADKRLTALHADGHLSDEKYHAYRQLVVKARVLAFFPGLPLDSMGIKPNDLATSEFAQAYIKTYLEKNFGLGEHSDVPNYNLINAMIAEAAAIVTPESAQADILAHINNQNNPTPSAEQQSNQNEPEASETLDNKLVQEILNRMESDGPLWKDRAIALRGLMARGYSLEVACGFVGNAIVESHKIGEPYGAINWNIEQYGGGPGRGGWQWGSYESAYDRFGHDSVGKEGTLRWYAAQHNLDWWDPEAQLGFIDYELRHAEGAAAEKLRAAKTAIEASNIVLYDYERPAVPEESQERRAQHAQATATRFNVIRQNILNEQSMTNYEAPGNPNDSFFELNADIMNYLHDKYGTESGHLLPADLEQLGDTWGDAQLYPDAAKTFRIMSEAFEAEFGRPLQMSSDDANNAYRSYAEQERLKDQKPHLAAVPGTSNHGWGLSIDIGGGVNSGPDTPEYKWMVANAGKFGWGQEDFAKPGGSKPEAWHWTYMGGRTVVSVPGVHQGSPEDPGERIPVPISVRGYAHPVDPSLVHNLGTLYDGYTNMEGFHPGWDYEVPTGTRVYPVKPGVITEVGFENDSDGLDGDGAGNYIEIRHYDGTYSDYQHLSAENVAVGQTVDFGEVIGHSGNTGNTSGQHLHVTLREKGVDDFVSRLDDDVEAKTIDPATVMPALRVVNDWLEQNGHHRVEVEVGRVAVEATENHHEYEDSQDESAPSELEIRLGGLGINPPQTEQHGNGQVNGLPNNQQNPWVNAHNNSEGRGHN